jgi:hypothetical protein
MREQKNLLFENVPGQENTLQASFQLMFLQENKK